jgi:sugar-phosphatase
MDDRPSASGVRFLIFDLDGVLVDSRPAYRAAWRRWAQTHALDESLIWADAHGRRPEDIISRVRPELAPAEGLAAFDSLLDEELAAGCSPMPGAPECLAAFDVRRWTIVSSGRRSHVLAALDACDLPAPAALVSGDELAQGKPAPDGFLLGAERLSASPAECLVVEDAPVGVLAARAAGMMAIALTTTHEPAELSGATQIFASLNAARPYLSQFGER